jgi:hypothetical protein
VRSMTETSVILYEEGKRVSSGRIKKGEAILLFRSHEPSSSETSVLYIFARRNMKYSLVSTKDLFHDAISNYWSRVKSV